MSQVEREGIGSGRCVCCSFACAVVNIFCFSCVRCLCPCCFPPPPPIKPEFSVLCLGLDGAGKSTLLALLAGEPTGQLEPTMGFSIKSISTPSKTFHIKELGGAEKIRPYWNMYYNSDLDALIFVVDSSSDDDMLLDAKGWLQRCLTDSANEGLPLLVLCSKQDLGDIRTPHTISQEMGLAHMCQGRQFKVEGCSLNNLEGLKTALDSLAEMVNVHKNSGHVKMGWV